MRFSAGNDKMRIAAIPIEGRIADRSTGAREAGGGAAGRLLLDHYRWLLMALPPLVLLLKGAAAWPLAAALAMAAGSFMAARRIAERRWPDRAGHPSLYVRCSEIALIGLMLFLLYRDAGDIRGYYYIDGFYAIFVALAGISLGRRGAFWCASAAALAVAAGRLTVALDVPSMLAATEYWIAVLSYAATYGLIFLAIGLLTHLATALRSQHEATSAIAVMRSASDRRRIEEIAAHRERLATIGEVTAQVIHELSTPLTGILSVAEYLQGVMGEREQDSLRMIRGEADRAASMVRELLDYSRRSPEQPNVSLNAAVERALDLCDLRYRSSPVEITKELSPASPRLAGEPSRIEQIVLNLVENAKQAVEEHGSGRITVRTHVNGERVSLEVTDTGPGIPPDIKDHIFEPFFTTKEPGRGTGLGLAIVARLVRECGGEIEVRSNQDVGTTFLLQFQKSA